MSKSKSYDARQTIACNQVYEYLASIVTLAHDAKNHVGSDKFFDLMADIESDLAKALKVNERLVNNEV